MDVLQTIQANRQTNNAEIKSAIPSSHESWSRDTGQTNNCTKHYTGRLHGRRHARRASRHLHAGRDGWIRKATSRYQTILASSAVHLTRNNTNHVYQANPMENSTECKSATTLVSSQHRVHTAIGAAIASKPTNARNFIIHVCAEESAIEEHALPACELTCLDT